MTGNAPYTLRDLRRIVSKIQSGKIAWLGYQLADLLDDIELMAGLREPGQPRRPLAQRAALLARVLDDLIRQYGPLATVYSAQVPLGERPEAERTDHQTGAKDISDGPHSNPAASSHGGDGNSGECEHPAETAAQGRKGDSDEALTPSADTNSCQPGDTSNGQPGGGIGAAPQGAGTEAAASPTSPGAESPAKPAEAGEGREASGDGSPDPEGTAHRCDAAESGDPAADAAADPETDPCGTDRPACDRSYGAEADSGRPSGGEDEVPQGEQSNPENRRTPYLRPELMVESLQAKYSHFAVTLGGEGHDQRQQTTAGGGHACDYKQAIGAKIIPADAKGRIITALRGLMDLVRQRSITTPRWDAPALVRELVSRRYAIHRARKRIDNPRYVLLMPDMSGSCDWIARLTAAACAEVARGNRRLLIAPTAWKRSPCEGVVGKVFGADAKKAREVESLWPSMVASAWYDRPEFLRDTWRRTKAAGVEYILALGDVHGHHSYEAARDVGIKVIWCDPNGRAMRVKDKVRMAYAYIHGKDAYAIADAVDEAAKTARNL